MHIAPHYREAIWKKLLNHPDWEVHFYYGDCLNGIKSIDFEKDDFYPYKDRLHKVKNYWWKKEILLWQTNVISECLKGKFDYAVFTSEMSRPSTWIAATICRLRRIKVVFWAHGLYGNEKGLKLRLKKIFFRLPHKFILYERRAKKILVNHGFSPDNLYVVFNSLDYEAQKLLFEQIQSTERNGSLDFIDNPQLPIVIFIGRLTKVKKLNLLIEAINQVNHETPKVNLLIIGDGPERGKLEEIGERGLKNRWVYFTGACYDEQKTAQFLSMADLCVSPGDVGLSGIHSLSFGTPVGTHDNMFNQMPEAEAVQEGFNGFFFKENDVNDLQLKIENWITIADREKMRENSREIIDKYYNPYYQQTVFERLFSDEKPEI